jgi:hypothetical protein
MEHPDTLKESQKAAINQFKTEYALHLEGKTFGHFD